MKSLFTILLVFISLFVNSQPIKVAGIKPTIAIDDAVSFTGFNNVYALGDSYTNPGLGATAPTLSNMWLQKALDVMTGRTLSNYADIGTGYQTSLHESLENLPGEDNTEGGFILCGINDVNLRGSAANNLSTCYERFLSIIINHFLGTAATAGSGTYTQPGQWNRNYEPPFGKAAYITDPTYGAAIANSNYPTSGELSYSFSGSHVVLGYYSSNSYAAGGVVLGTFDVYIDDVFVETIDSHESNSVSYPGWEVFGEYNPRTRLYTGLSTGAHTIKIRVTDVRAAGIIIDYFGLLCNPNNAAPLVVMSAPKIANYNQGGSYVNGSDAAVDAYNSEIFSVITLIKSLGRYPIAFGLTNSTTPASMAIDTGADFDPDGIHMDQSGHDKLRDRVLSKISSY